ncbi:hypothetical protein BT69DRAFT_318094 [Atractiella rhizophila]|nr:hypothetical protein BT69DRAFT_318094 [Atractiella rhizophila]
MSFFDVPSIPSSFSIQNLLQALNVAEAIAYIETGFGQDAFDYGAPITPCPTPVRSMTRKELDGEALVTALEPLLYEETRGARMEDGVMVLKVYGPSESESESDDEDWNDESESDA